MIKRILFPVVTLLLLTVMIASPTFASGYILQIFFLSNGGLTYIQLPIVQAINNTYLANNLYIASDGLDTRVIGPAGNQLPHMVVNDRLLFVSNLSASSITEFDYVSGYPKVASMPVITGYGGNFSTPDNATLEPGSSFQLDISGYTGSTGNLLNKLDAIAISYNTTTSKLNVAIGNNTTPAVAINSTVAIGEHDIRVLTLNGTSLISLYVDDMNTAAVTGAIASPVPDNGNSWIWAPLPYINSVKLQVGN